MSLKNCSEYLHIGIDMVNELLTKYKKKTKTDKNTSCFCLKIEKKPTISTESEFSTDVLDLSHFINALVLIT